MTYYKVLNDDGSCCHSGKGQWLLPMADGPGEPMPLIEGDLIPYKRGYHILRAEHLIEWLGPALFEVEALAPIFGWKNKCGTAQARLLRRVETWNDRTARLFAADCMERVLPIWERDHPNDARPRAAVDSERQFARGEISAAERGAAWTAAWDAGWAAERQWQTERLMQYLKGEVS